MPYTTTRKAPVARQFGGRPPNAENQESGDDGAIQSCCGATPEAIAKPSPAEAHQATVTPREDRGEFPAVIVSETQYRSWQPSCIMGGPWKYLVEASFFPVACELPSELRVKQVQPAPVQFGSNSYYNLLRDSCIVR